MTKDGLVDADKQDLFRDQLKRTFNGYLANRKQPAQGTTNNSNAAQFNNIDRLVTTIFRDLSTNETLIELRRCDLARHPEFEPMKLFKRIDINNNGQVTRNEFFDFMNKQFL